MLFEPVKCVVCKNCIRTCKDLRGIGTVKHAYTQSGKSLKEGGYLFYGACMEVRPTAVIREKRKSVSHVKNKVPCKESYPIGIDIAEFPKLVKDTDYYKAINLVEDKSPFSKACSYICHGPRKKL